MLLGLNTFNLWELIKTHILDIKYLINAFKRSIKSILFLPFIGVVIDIARLCGYLLGYMDRLFGNSNN